MSVTLIVTHPNHVDANLNLNLDLTFAKLELLNDLCSKVQAFKLSEQKASHLERLKSSAFGKKATDVKLTTRKENANAPGVRVRGSFSSCTTRLESSS